MTSLHLRGLTVIRDGATLIERATLSVAAGEFVGVIGPNGAGKSTLLRALAGAEGPDDAVFIDEAPIARMAPRRRARLIAYLPQTRDIFWSMTAEAVVSLGRFAYGEARRLSPAGRAAVDAALAATDSGSFRSRVASTLSGGEQARIHLARALAAEAPILIADEPTAALDLKHALAIMKILNGKAAAGGLVVAALHDLALARRFCTRLVVLHDGRIVADGDPDAVLSEGTLSGVFGLALSEMQSARIA